MTGKLEEIFNKIKDDEMSLPEFVEWVGTIMDQADSVGYDRGFDQASIYYPGFE